MIFLISIPLAIIAFLLEAYPRIINREYGVDIWTHLLYLKEYKKQNGIPKLIKNGFIVSGVYDYPPMFIWILSKFPFRYVKRYEFLFSPFFDAVHILVIFQITYFVTSNIFVSLLTQLFYILTPIIILENSSATPRSLGYTFFTLLMTSLIFYTIYFNPFLLIIAVFLGSLIFLTHRFTTQGFLFFSIAFSIYQKNLLFILVFLTGFFISIIISKGFYLRVLRGHLGNLKFWKDNIKYRYAHQVKGNIPPSKTNDFIFKLYTQFLKFPPFVLEITNPWYIIVFYSYFYVLNPTKVESAFFLWAIIAYLFALLTIWVPQLRFLGEGQRYLELSAFPVAFITATFFSSTFTAENFSLVVFIYTIIGVASIVTIFTIQRKAIINEKLRTITPDMKKMFSYLRKLKNKPKLLCIPHQITTSTIYHTNCPVYVNASYSTINKISDIYPYIKRPIRMIMKKYGLTHILINTNYIDIEELKIKKYNKEYEVGTLILLSL